MKLVRLLGYGSQLDRQDGEMRMRGTYDSPITDHYLRTHFRPEKCQTSAASRPSKSFLLIIPVTWSRSCPFLKNSSEGIARILYLKERL